MSYSKDNLAWLGTIPDHWQVSKLRQVLSPFSEKNHPDMPLLSVVREKGVIIRNVESKEENHNYVPDDLSNYKLVKQGQFTMNKMKAWQGSYGVSKYDGIVSPAYFVFNFKCDINGDFFNAAIRSKAYVSYFGQASDGIRVGQWDLSMARMKDIPFLVPPREEQDQIVRFLDWKVSSINKLINIKKKEIKEIDALKRSMVSHAITRGLTADAPMKYSGVKWLGDIPQRWYTVPLYAIAQVKSINNCIDLPLMSVYLDAGVVPFVEREEKRTNATSKDLTNYQRVDPGDFVLNNQQAWRGSVGVSFHSGIVSPAYIVLSLNNTLDSHYANYLFRSRCMVDQYLVISRGVGSIQRNLYWSALKRVVVPIPSKKEQMEIVEYLDGLNNKFDATIKKLTEEVAVLEEYKNKIIADTVTGKIDVRGIEIPEYEFVDEDTDTGNEDGSEEETEEQED
jgi:type I restriction enzyme S subunit